MNLEDYKILSKELQELSKRMPLNWGKIQNNRTDSKVNLFSIKNENQLEFKIKSLSEADQNYFRRRWFLWQCSKVDEFLFYNNESVTKNPDSKDQNWDVQFHHNRNLRFDIKGTVVPKTYRENFSPSDEEQLIKFYYDKQSRGVRDHLQNRIFIVHHSYYKEDRSRFLRCHWNLKQQAYSQFIDLAKSSEMSFTPYKSVKAKCIFILESSSKEFTFQINT